MVTALVKKDSMEQNVVKLLRMIHSALTILASKSMAISGTLIKLLRNVLRLEESYLNP